MGKIESVELVKRPPDLPRILDLPTIPGLPRTTGLDSCRSFFAVSEQPQQASSLNAARSRRPSVPRIALRREVQLC
ncbi:hypothetical protein SAMN06265222_101564 [Neorhodopirellula lusitana]|uniref:Uncharacterized protein n=1 Tax=Neorhodopirellula lusitana TaxID=445327 RepID=A0ABY1PPH6_9BACT|nr:hypothetical protein SAMN06265222_101564 [Neorhodopirellula lusitana]